MVSWQSFSSQTLIFPAGTSVVVGTLPQTILVVDDDANIAKIIVRNLVLEGYQTLEARTGQEALQHLRLVEPDLILLDVEMPQLDGFETLGRIRRVSEIPVIMLTVRAEVSDKIRGLELGADDYLTKPFNRQELNLRIKAVLRRFEPPEKPEDLIIRIDDRLQFDQQRRDVIVDGERISLRPTEYRLLRALVENAGWAQSHEALLTKVWGYEYRDDNHLLRLYITYLRKKIEIDPAQPRYIFTNRGLGYRFVDFRNVSPTSAVNSE